MTPTCYSKRIFALLAGGLLALALVSPAMAQKEERKTKQTVAMSQSVFEKLQEIQVLVEAQENPELHRDLVVRVSGFSAYFVTLDQEVQNDVIRRRAHA